MTEVAICPRFEPGPWKFTGECNWDSPHSGRHCAYCGSLHPDDFMARLEAGTVMLSGTDKNYKVYVHNDAGELFTRHFRNCPRDAKCTGPEDCTHWTAESRKETKFYFMHLSEDQMRRFVEMYNERKLKYVMGGNLYVMPYFMRSARATG